MHLKTDCATSDLAILEQIEAANRLRSMLVAQVENDAIILDRTEMERDAWAAHAKSLAEKLVQARKRIARLERAFAEASGQPLFTASSLCNTDDREADADEDARHVAELLQLQISQACPELQAATGPSAQSAPASQAQRRAESAALYPASLISATAEMQAAKAASQDAVRSSALSATAEVGQGDPACGAGGAGPGPGSVTVNPTPNQQRVLEALVQRGRAMGWLIQPGELTMGSVLGEGEFGITYLATWRHAAVAVKVMRLRHSAELTTFLREVESMSYIRHPNVVPFLGACLSGPDKLMLVSEYMTGGTLCDWLHPGGLPAPGTQSGGLTRPVKPLLERLKMAHQVAMGMCALEACRPPVLHRDLKPANVYLDQRGLPRVGDFGLSRRLLEQARVSLTGETGTYLYMAPEVMRHEIYDTKADVWSWGVLLSECITCAVPYSNMYMTPVQVALAVSAEELAPTAPPNIHEEVQVVLRLACQFDPEMRPDFASLADMLGGAIKHMEAQELAKPTLMASIQSGLVGLWSGGWGKNSFSRAQQQQRQQQQ
ncbi:hypothetical protein Vretimale_12346 [Volvox reticuliferus]|uniref:Protein kinase domain-containing protein n=2 Tax=Volvox reticuliferus TaxID=1737510 RepID=A0A8J4GJ68_9CHLO|nr:hypothetical protein Vretifemale_9056 [Volvox reticuliferus]GIM08361.1 hypothetical protein Vretimale_12346 [Volvox reticuliferus]